MSFDRLARAYRWLEWLTFGPSLQRCRARLLATLSPATNALVLGDGDGRALAALLRHQPSLRVTSVDLSPAMLRLQRARCSPATTALVTLAGDALSIVRSLPQTEAFELVTSHFFFDCFSQPQLESLVREVTERTSRAGSQWLVSEFRVPSGWRALPARNLIRALYLGFRGLTGLRVRTLPDHSLPLTRSGWTRVREVHSLGGLLSAELWQRSPAAGPAL